MDSGILSHCSTWVNEVLKKPKLRNLHHNQNEQVLQWNESRVSLTCGIYVEKKDMKIRGQVVMVGEGKKKNYNMIKHIWKCQNETL